MLAILLTCLLSPASALAQASPLPLTSTGIVLDDLNDEAVFTIDLETLPPRPRMTSEVVPDAQHPDLEIETEWVCDLDCFLPGPAIFCAAGSPCVGDESLARDVHACSPHGGWIGHTCEVTVRPLDFGANGAPATVDLSVFAVTDPLSTTQSVAFDTTPVPTSVTIERDRDTMIFEDAQTGGNGQGQFIWAGTKVVFTPPILFERDERRGLLNFSLPSFSLVETVPIPPGSTINDAEIMLEATALASALAVNVGIYRVADAGGFIPSLFYSGEVDLNGDEFNYSGPIQSGASWLSRGSAGNFWNAPGGDLAGGALDVVSIAGPGTVLFQSPALTATVEDMWQSGDYRNGFMLLDQDSGSAFATKGVQFASGENPDSTIRPKLVVHYTPPIAAPTDGTISTNAYSFISEGEDFRWIYDTSVSDLNADGVVTTLPGGQCEVTNTQNPQSLPYNYQFLGDPSYVGLDCCTWQITSVGQFGNPDDDVVGTGQALFFVNLDPNEPSNFPDDYDGDGILDLCDNCMWRANGPLGGTCVGGAAEGDACGSNLDCGSGSVCQLSQEDSDGDFLGDVCMLPEPGFAVMLAWGTLCLSGASRTRRKNLL